MRTFHKRAQAPILACDDDGARGRSPSAPRRRWRSRYAVNVPDRRRRDLRDGPRAGGLGGGVVVRWFPADGCDQGGRLDRIDCAERFPLGCAVDLGAQSQRGDIVGGCHCLHLFDRAVQFLRGRDHLRGRLRDKFHHPSERVRDAVAVNQRRTHPAPDDDPTVRDQRCRLDVHDNGATDSSRPHLRVDHVGDRRAACRGFDDDQSGSGGDDSDDRRIGRSHRLLGCGRRSHHRHDPGDVIGSGPWACSGARPRSASLSRWSGLGDEDRES